MKLACPNCQSQFELAAAIELAAGRGALYQALSLSGELGRLMAHYIGMFRPAKRALSNDRAERLLSAIVPQISGQFVLRRGEEYAAPTVLWINALQSMCELRDAGKLAMPLKSHGYLLEIVAAQASQGTAKAEREMETAMRTGDRNAAAALRAKFQERQADLTNDLRLKVIDEETYRVKRAKLKEEFGL